VQDQYIIVRTSLLGSIIVNLLLVLGLAIITGELKQRGQRYSIFATRVAATLLCLTTVSLLIPVSVPLLGSCGEGISDVDKFVILLTCPLKQATQSLLAVNL
jgi:calcium/proton exchanger cax